MAKYFLFVFTLLLIATTSFAQKSTTGKWHTYYIGGKKGYFIKTYEVSKNGVIENQYGSGGQFDNNPMTIPVVDVVVTDADERVITDYSDSNFYVIIFKNFTPLKASVFYCTEPFKTIDEAKTFKPKETDFIDWYSKEGLEAEDKKPVMPPFTKKDALEFANFMGAFIAEATKKIDADKKEEKGLALALQVATLPSQFAQSKGFHAYKSLPVIDKGMNKFKNDADLKKVLKNYGL
jgi:hypothetical protein